MVLKFAMLGSNPLVVPSFAILGLQSWYQSSQRNAVHQQCDALSDYTCIPTTHLHHRPQWNWPSGWLISPIIRATCIKAERCSILQERHSSSNKSLTKTLTYSLAVAYVYRENMMDKCSIQHKILLWGTKIWSHFLQLLHNSSVTIWGCAPAMEK